MKFIEFVLLLEKRLQQPLPGKIAQLRMSSRRRLQELIQLVSTEDAIQSSVLILLYPSGEKIGLALMLRPDYPGIHSGQISLPGGKFEDTDESLVYTALREAQEEIGIDPMQVQVIGQLTEMYIPPSNYLVTPVVGYQISHPEFRADPLEVKKIIEISLEDLLNKKNRRKKSIKVRGFTLNVPSYFIEGNIIWGATAMILSELTEIAMEIMFKASAGSEGD